MSRAQFGQMHCSMARALDIIGDTWTPLILRDVYLGLNRFDDLVIDLGISRNLLTTRLDHLVDAQVVERRPYQVRLPRYEYRLTEAGRDLMPVLMALTAWGDRWVGPEPGPPILFEHSCGQVVTPTVTCPACHEAFTTDTVTPRPGPGGRASTGTLLLAQRGPRRER